MHSIRHGRSIDVPVDGRSDVYSLGVLLYEALGGSTPGRSEDGALLPLRRLNAQVSPGLSDLIHKCIRPDPCDRYQSAAVLAGDLRRHLNHMPLVGVPNRSVIERWRKWRRRQPEALERKVFLVLVAATAIAAAALFLDAYRRRARELAAALGESRAYVAASRFAEAERTLKRARAVAGSNPAFASWRRVCEAELRAVRRDRKAGELHRLADSLRFREGLAPRPSDEARVLLQHGRAIWDARGLLLASVPGRHEPEVERRIRNDLLDIMTIWADLRVRLAPASEAVQARREALAQLDRAAALLGSSPALERLRRACGKALGGAAAPSDTAASLPEPCTAWEHCDLGRAYLRDGDYARAFVQFQQAVELRPQDFWPNFYQGVCAYKFGRFEAAKTAFRVCISLADNPAECYFNRALTCESLGQRDEARSDYTHALQCDEALTGAALNRGILHYAAGRHAEAAADFDRALATDPEREMRGLIHYNRALVKLASDDRPAALADLKAASDYGHSQARDLRNRLELQP
jgi:eukaryotic-like serine/threonine-protein kinase